MFIDRLGIMVFILAKHRRCPSPHIIGCSHSVNDDQSNGCSRLRSSQSFLHQSYRYLDGYLSHIRLSRTSRICCGQCFESQRDKTVFKKPSLADGPRESFASCFFKWILAD
ncbi:Hypothetical predicted protein [Octopus vulgaris]|uniref:Uncharacterized protein n=1 Tax=Octopus vulgaris TaxID=6645 RepID=A0AA36BD30_OCTVU|nr:Hypothetical predicted protein [Octopus vulgaris]